MEQIPLTAQLRTVTGRKVKTLRKQGIIPAHIFGNKVKTVHIQVTKTAFSKVFEKAGETGLVEVVVDGQKYPTLIRNVQIHPVSDEPLHIDFYKVNLQEKVAVNVPVEITGEAPAEQKKIGLLLTPVGEIEVEALPTDIPENIEVDISKLANIGDEIRVKDLSIDKSKIEVLSDEELVVASIGELVTKEQQELEAQMEAEQAEATAAEEAPAEGEEVKAEGKEAAETPAAEGEEKPKEEKATPEQDKKPE